jgi:Delta14-sterol reductase
MFRDFAGVPTLAATLIYLVWFVFQVILQIAAPGKTQEGPALSDGTRLKYKINGWFAFWFTLAAAGAAVILGWIPSTILYDHFGALFATANIFAGALSCFLYWYGRGNGLRDFVMGSALNPRIGSFDLKFFCEARPGLILWILMNLSFAAKQYQLYGRITTPMILVNAFQFLYIADYYFHEEAILTTWDIRHECFGLMLCWGDLVWVPFIYSLQAHYLITQSRELSLPAMVSIVALNMFGYAIFRGANLQKHKFRQNPRTLVWGKAPDLIETDRGTPLLASGWWGIARHLNYLGDLLMALAWCLPAGFESPIPYFYFVYFTVLLIHREWRDNRHCREKYGEAWDAYCRKVPWRIVPGIY